MSRRRPNPPPKRIGRRLPGGAWVPVLQPTMLTSRSLRRLEVLVDSAAPIPIQSPWLRPLGFTEPLEDSERLIRALEAHTAAEEPDIADCAQVAHRTGDPIVDLSDGSRRRKR